MVKLVAKTYIDDQRNYFDITVEDNHNFVLADGTVVHNCGAGAGVSVQEHHVAKLPKIKARTKAPKLHTVEDSIEGWAASLDVLMSSFFEDGGKHPEYRGHKVFFDLTKVRPKNSQISGGFLAPGPEPLRRALDRIEYLLTGLVLQEKSAATLRPIHVYDICMHAADAVLSEPERSFQPILADPIMK